MVLESAEVIAHRTGRIATAGARPSVRDQREFARMAQEKLDAALESAQAMMAQLAAMNAALLLAPLGSGLTASQLSRSMARLAWRYRGRAGGAGLIR